MSLQTFCDLVWVEIHDDCSPMGDQAQWREIVTKLFIEGIPAWEITYEGFDDKGKKVRKRLAPRPAAGSPTGSAVADARALFEKLKGASKVDTKTFVESVQAAKIAAEVASPPNG
jgi:hypothetical protein